MAVQQRKKSKQRCRQRKGANQYKGIASSTCPKCGAAVMPHRICKGCGDYKGKEYPEIVGG